MLSKSFKSGKCKTSLKLAASRIKLLKNRREVQVKKLKQEVAQLLATGQETTARIRIENVIREEKIMSAYDLIEMYCELIAARLPIIESQKSCPIDLKEAVSSVIFASPRCADVPELADVHKQFAAKYGKEFARSALELRPDCGVNRLIIEKLSAKAPDTDTKLKILTAIAKEHEIDWDSKAFEEELHKSDDLLNGSSKHIGANKMLMERSNSDFTHDSTQKESVSNILQADAASTQASFNPTNANLRTTTPLVPIVTSKESRESDGKSGLSEVKGLRQKEEIFLSKQPTWRMEFKDAASAAQAAAESAERASMAARAAAELASQESISRQNSYETKHSSVQNSRDERAIRSVSSKLKEPVIIEHDQVKDSPRMKVEEVHKVPRDEMREEISNSSFCTDSLHSSQLNNAKKLDGYQEIFSQIESEDVKNSDDANFTGRSVDLRYDRSASANFISAHDDEINSAPSFDKHETGIHNNLDYDDDEMSSRNRIFSYHNKQQSSGDYPTAVFDDYGPESTADYKENLLDSFERVQNHQPFTASSSSITSNVFTTSATMEKASSSKNFKNNAVISDIFSSSPQVSPRATIEKAPSSKFEDRVSATYDDSDSLTSESENEMTSSRNNEIVYKSTLLHQKSNLIGGSYSSKELQPSSSKKAQLQLETEEKEYLQVSSSELLDEKPAKEDKFSLNFKRLTGGFKNRGYNHPPYSASSVIDSPSVSLTETLSSTISIPEKVSSQPIEFLASSPTGFRMAQPVFNQEKSRRYIGDDPNPSKQLFDKEETSTTPKVVNQKAYKEERHSEDDIESRGNAKANTTIRFSRRTKDLSSKGRANLSKSTAYLDMPDSITQNQPSGGGPAIESPSQIVEETKIPKGKQLIKSSENTNTSEENSTKNKLSDSSGGSKLQAGSQKSVHVHPKLPDYETLAAHFQSLRSNRR